MSSKRKINSKAKTDTNTGFGENASSYGGRLINKNGNPNIEKKGISFLERLSWFHTMLSLPKWKFLTVIFSFYIIVNFIFAIIYYVLGTQHLNGISGVTEIDKFAQTYFFSAQTFTTVGYGHVSPTGFYTSIVAAMEALVGLLAFALATGLLYGRFSKPKAHIKFSENAIIAPYKDSTALMLRLTPHKNTSLIDSEAKVTLAISDDENGIRSNKFFPLDLEMQYISALALSWTLVHHITEESPLFDFKESDFQSINGEIIVYFKAFDEMFSNTVSIRTSYVFKEVVYGAKFAMMYHRSLDNSKTVLEIDKLNNFDRVSIG